MRTSSLISLLNLACSKSPLKVVTNCRLDEDQIGNFVVMVMSAGKLVGARFGMNSLRGFDTLRDIPFFLM